MFFTSGAVLVLEILAGRLLAPYVGVSIETYTAVIGTVLAGIATGSWIGGYVADRVNPRRILGPLIVAGGALCLAVVPFVRVAGSAAGGGGSGGSLRLALAAFFAPAAVLSAVTPTVVKLQLRSLEVTGRVVGWLSALATAGAIGGTFLAGFVLVEAAATTTSILVIGISLMVAGTGIWLWLWRARASAVVAIGAVALLGAALGEAAGDPCDVETVYHCARVVPDEDRPSGRLLVLDTLRHSYVDLEDPTHLEFGYTKAFADVVEAVAPPGALRVLHIGGGGFTMPRYFRAVRPGTTGVVLEIDPGVVELAQQRLGARPGPDLEVHVGDARQLVAELRPGAYDVAVGDAFAGLSVPWHLTTLEFARAVRSKLQPGGLYVLNVIDHPPLRFARAEAATLLRVFGHVVVVARPETMAGEQGGNLVLAASDRPIAEEQVRSRLAARAAEEQVLAGSTFAGGEAVLTDDHAPVDQWLARARRRAAVGS